MQATVGRVREKLDPNPRVRVPLDLKPDVIRIQRA
jgi:hypothetical protein